MMDNNVVVVIIVAILAVVILAGFFLFRGKSKAAIQAGPFNMSYEGSNPADKTPAPVEPPVEFAVSNVKAGKNIDLSDQAGGRMRVDQLEAEKGSVTITRTEGGPDPKA